MSEDEKRKLDKELNRVSDNAYYYCKTCETHVYFKDAVESVVLDPVTQKPVHSIYTCPKCGNPLGC